MDEKLISRADAILGMHFPKTANDVHQARERLAFEELFELVSASHYNKQDNAKLVGWHIPFDQSVVGGFVQKLPFSLTDAQRRAAWDIIQDFERASPMNRLLQGDVGSEKQLLLVWRLTKWLVRASKQPLWHQQKSLRVNMLILYRNFLYTVWAESGTIDR